MRGREEGVSEPREIGRQDWQRRPLRTAAPPPPGCSHGPGRRRRRARPALRHSPPPAGLPLSARPARALAPAPDTGVPRAPPGARWGRPGAGAPRLGHVSAGCPDRPPAPPGRPPSPGLRSEPGRRVTTSPRFRRLSLFPGDPPLTAMPHHPSSCPGAPILIREH